MHTDNAFPNGIVSEVVRPLIIFDRNAFKLRE